MKAKLALVFLISILLNGCGLPQAEFQPQIGFLYSDVKAPVMTEFERTSIPNNNGEGHTITVQYSILGVSIGDASLATAVKNGLLREGDYADYHHLNVLTIYQKVTLIAYGDKK